MLKSETDNEFKTIKSADGALELEFCPQAGGSITGFRYRDDGKVFDLFTRWGESTLVSLGYLMASFPLTPYSNRITNHELSVDGKKYAIDPWFEEGNQLHGDGWVSAWKNTNLGPHHAVLELTTGRRPSSPYAYHAKQTFRLAEGRLEIAMEITNRSGIRLPFGLGHHPFIPKNDRTIFKASLPRVWLTRDKMVPSKLIDTPARWDFSDGIELKDSNFDPADQGGGQADCLDNCFQGWDQKAEIIWPDRGLRMTMTAEPVFANFVIYLGQRKDWFCAEPVTNIIDGFNLHARGVADTGTIFLNDGETLAGNMWFKVDKG